MTGGAGFIGATLVRALLARGNSVVVLDSGAVAGFHNLAGVPARIVVGDIGDAAVVSDAMADVDAVVHLAAQAGVVQSISDPLADHSVNVVGSLNILEAARATGVRRFVFASSNAVLGNQAPPLNEQLVPNPVSPYGASKAAVEAYLGAYCAAYGLEGVALRFANAYGPWSAHKPSVVAAFVMAHLGGGPLVIHGTGHQTRDLVHADDVAACIIACLEAPAADVSGETFQVGTGIETSLLDLAKVLFEVAGGKVEIRFGQPSPGDVARNVSDISKIQRVLGYSPRVGLHQGLEQTVTWFRDNWNNSA